MVNILSAVLCRLRETQRLFICPLGDFSFNQPAALNIGCGLFVLVVVMVAATVAMSLGMAAGAAHIVPQ